MSWPFWEAEGFGEGLSGAFPVSSPAGADTLRSRQFLHYRRALLGSMRIMSIVYSPPHL